MVLTLTLATGKKLVGDVRKRAVVKIPTWEKDIALVEIADYLDFQDSKLGTIKIPWQEINSILITYSGEVKVTFGDKSHHASGRLRPEYAKMWIEESLGSSRQVLMDAEINLWFRAKEVIVNLTELKSARLDR